MDCLRLAAYVLVKNNFKRLFTELKKPITEEEFQRQVKEENVKGLKHANKKGCFKYHVGCEKPSQIKHFWIYAVCLPTNKNQSALYKVLM